MPRPTAERVRPSPPRWTPLRGDPAEVVYGIGKPGDITVAEALTGGYPELVTTMKSLPPTSRIRYAFGAPGDASTLYADVAR